MSTLFIPVGIPGCGKSTMARAMGCDIVSTDTIRRLLTGDENNQDCNGEVFKRFHSEIYARLSNGRNVFADATNLDSSSRRELMCVAGQVKKIQPVVHTHLIVFRNLEQAIRRNADRERVVSADVMMKMIEKHERAIAAINHHEIYDCVTEVRSVR